MRQVNHLWKKADISQTAQERWRILGWFSLRFLLLLMLVWELVVVGLTFKYVWHLLNPTCPAGMQFAEGFQSITLQTTDDLLLDGWYHTPENGVVILLMGGNGASRDTMLPEAHMLADHGYGSLLVEGRSCAGVLSTLGGRETDDLLEMVTYASQQPGIRHLGVLGFSAGGVAAIRAAARDHRIEAVIAEGNYASLQSEFTNSGSFPFSLQWQMEQLTAVFYRLLTGISPNALDPLADLSRISPRPVLLIFGDLEAENAQAGAQYTAASEPRELWILPGVGHGGYLQSAPQEYENRIITFLNSAFHQ